VTVSSAVRSRSTLGDESMAVILGRHHGSEKMTLAAFAFTLSGFWLTQLLAVISPGPSLLVVLRSSIAISRRAGVLNALGFATGSVTWAVTAMLGLNILFAAFPWIYTTIKIAGGMYLIYLAYKMIKSPGMAIDDMSTTPFAEKASVSYVKGLVIQLSNPKVVIFMGSILTSLLPAFSPTALKASILAVIFLNEFVWYSFVAYASSVPRIRYGYSRASRIVDRVAGIFLGGLGVRIIAS